MKRSFTGLYFVMFYTVYLFLIQTASDWVKTKTKLCKTETKLKQKKNSAKWKLKWKILQNRNETET